MIVGVQGTSGFSDYQVFLRSMGVAMSMLKDEDKEFNIYSAGPGNVNDMVSEFTNLSERGMKSRGKKIKFYKVAPSWIAENIDHFNYIAYLSLSNEANSKLVNKAQDHEVEVGIFKY
jgi:hypothetical protein